jgi:hypothetical protein
MMKVGDLVRVTFSDGEVVVGEFYKNERGFIVILSHGIEVPFREDTATVEIINKNQKNT